MNGKVSTKTPEKNERSRGSENHRKQKRRAKRRASENMGGREQQPNERERKSHSQGQLEPKWNHGKRFVRRERVVRVRVDHDSGHEIPRVVRGIEFVVDIVGGRSDEDGFSTEEFWVESSVDYVDEADFRVFRREKIYERTTFLVGEFLSPFEFDLSFRDVHSGHAVGRPIGRHRDGEDRNIPSKRVKQDGIARIALVRYPENRRHERFGRVVPIGIYERDVFNAFGPVENGNDFFFPLVVFGSYEHVRILRQEVGEFAVAVAPFGSL
jgi:hypothetical protein